MVKFSYLTKEKVGRMPKTSGVYCFKNARGLLYIGKAASLKTRVKNHLVQPTWHDAYFIGQATSIGYIQTDSEITALLLESQLIKKYQPRYNIMLRDDKQYFYVGFSKDKLPILVITHRPKPKIRYLGPFTDGKSLKTVLRYLRRIFSYYTKKHKKLPCQYCHLNLCPGPNPNIAEYNKDIAKIKAILNGKKPRVLSSLKKEMARFAKDLEFEKAAKARDQLAALENIFAHRPNSESSLLASRGFEGRFGMVPRRGQNGPSLGAPRWRGENDARYQIAKTRILDNIESLEAYDISNIQGKEPVGSMIRFDNGRPNKSMYRRFKIRLPEKPDDFAMMREVIRRRLLHPEWAYPDIFLIDGGRGQLNAALQEFTSPPAPLLTKERGERGEVVALAKRFNELYVSYQKNPIPLSSLPRDLKNLLMYARDEAHRFAISYHRKLHRRAFRF
ncbi:MAG: UvrB/UvrC motif-containing protein [Candidatus Spechtbacteria bacterium]|nr:UvrB/UvrC motif-containing protein [Candidatus Spechtbacteria bacterium]